MYTLYAEDTRDGAIHRLADLRSVRFSRAMREARKIPKARGGARYFVAKANDDGSPDMQTAASLDVVRKPASVGSITNQLHQRQILKRQKGGQIPRTTPVLWEDMPGDY